MQVEEGTPIYIIVKDGKELVVDCNWYIPGVTEEVFGELGVGFFLTEKDADTALVRLKKWSHNGKQ